MSEGGRERGGRERGREGGGRERERMKIVSNWFIMMVIIFKL